LNTASASKLHEFIEASGVATMDTHGGWRRLGRPSGEPGGGEMAGFAAGAGTEPAADMAGFASTMPEDRATVSDLGMASLLN